MAAFNAGDVLLARYIGVPGAPVLHCRLVLATRPGTNDAYALTLDLDHYEETFEVGPQFSEVHVLGHARRRV